ncbi:hypothetical protein [Gandjariella thermophila]|uniref:Uncharacterized protein n=1 Tax=Gandjariella thermophila TaxID=1931992 RepID=A0A4D4JD11_9PSEU|nr:hypothetical protein [Gandjariella thermophila]GDY32548.1 hypothetical protein GTS_41810 [Gandjariella thermophila]
MDDDELATPAPGHGPGLGGIPGQPAGDPGPDEPDLPGGVPTAHPAGDRSDGTADAGTTTGAVPHADTAADEENPDGEDADTEWVAGRSERYRARDEDVRALFGGHEPTRLNRVGNRGQAAFGDHSIAAGSVYFGPGPVGNHGPATLAPHSVAANIAYVGAGADAGPAASSAPLSDSYVAELRETYVEVVEFDRVLRTLREHGVVYLHGTADGGRWSTACAALARLVGDGGLNEVDLGDGGSLRTLVFQPDLLHGGRGHVVRLSGTQEVRAGTLGVLAARAAERKALVAAVAEPISQGAADLDPYAVPHTPPDPDAVLRRHLAALLDRAGTCVGGCAGCPGACRARWLDACMRDDRVRDELCLSPRPAQVALLARLLRDAAVTGRRPADALADAPHRLRQLASRILRETDSAEAEGGVPAARVQAARIAYALFDRREMTEVYHAAALLHRRLAPASPGAAPFEPGMGGVTIDAGFADLLHKDMGAPLGTATAGGRTARLANPGLAAAVLDVAWNDYDTLRAPLIGWLDDLAGDPRVPVQRRAAVLAGKLATYDFGYLYARLVRGWAGSRSARKRQAAAWAFDFAAEDGTARRLVRARLRDWTARRDRFLRDTAARAYATALGAAFVADAVESLRLIARDPEQMHRNAVARAFAELYQPESAEDLVAMLAEWARSDEQCLRVQAGRCAVLLARETAGDDDLWPALLGLARRDPASAARLVAVWQVALTEGRTATRAWQAIGRWLAAGDQDEDLAKTTEGFVIDLASHPAVRHRAPFYLRLHLGRRPGSTLARRILSEVDGK